MTNDVLIKKRRNNCTIKQKLQKLKSKHLDIDISNKTIDTYIVVIERGYCKNKKRGFVEICKLSRTQGNS